MQSLRFDSRFLCGTQPCPVEDNFKWIQSVKSGRAGEDCLIRVRPICFGVKSGILVGLYSTAPLQSIA